MDVKSFYEIFLQNPSICTDTRTLKPGDIYFALKGANFNGNLFANKAIEQGAAYAIVDEKPSTPNSFIIQVDNSLKFLQALARYHRDQFQIPVLGITGSNGKTTTKELITSILSQTYRCHATQGNFNNHIGVPLTLLQMKSDTELAVIEMGANRVGDIAELCEIANPSHGLITNVGKAHLEGFGSFDGVVRGKTELYRHIQLNGGELFVDQDNPHLFSRIGRSTYTAYSTLNRDASVYGKLLHSDPFLSFDYSIDQSPFYRIDALMAGDYNLKNYLAALAIGNYFNVPKEMIEKALSEYNPQNNRSQWLHSERNRILMDAYNANPDSMQLAIHNFVKLKEEKKILVLGEMLELGEYSIAEHQKLIDLIQLSTFEAIYLVGSNFRNVSTASYPVFDQVDELRSYLQQHPIANSAILIKGSRAVALERLLDVL